MDTPKNTASTKWLVLILALACGVLAWLLLRGPEVENPGQEQVSTVQSATHTPVQPPPQPGTANPAPTPSPPAAATSGADRAKLDPAQAFAMATNQQQAMQAIHEMERSNPASAIDARLYLAASCRMPIKNPGYYQQFPNSWHKDELFKYCQGYNDILSSENIHQMSKQGTKARLKEGLEAIEKSRGVDAAFSEIEDMLKTEQDAFAVQALFEYMGQHERQLYDFPLTSGLPPVFGGMSNQLGALGIASDLAYCETLGGCGAYHVRTLDVCNAMGSCPPGATMRDFYDLAMPPVLMQSVDIILARWRALRACGKYWCD